MCAFGKCRLQSSEPQTNCAADRHSLELPLECPNTHHLLCSWQRLLYLGVGYPRAGCAGKSQLRCAPGVACEGLRCRTISPSLRAAAINPESELIWMCFGIPERPEYTCTTSLYKSID